MLSDIHSSIMFSLYYYIVVYRTVIGLIEALLNIKLLLILSIYIILPSAAHYIINRAQESAYRPVKMHPKNWKERLWSENKP